LILLLLSPRAGFAQSFNCAPATIYESAKVEHVFDGDTLKLEDGRKVRLIGIDTPEVFSRKYVIPDNIKARGEQSKRALRGLLDSAKNRISLSYEKERFDRYGRTLAHVYLPDGQNLQAWLIYHGHALAFTTPPNDQMTQCYRRLEHLAQSKKLGIWQLDSYQLKSVNQLTENATGFHRLRGEVSKLLKTDKRLVIILDGQVEINIYTSDLHNFNLYRIQQLQGKTIEVRGWLKRKRTSRNMRPTFNKNAAQYRMTLRHEDSLNIDKVLH